FTVFWDHPDKKPHTTPTYIDYGGNGLVRTRCQEVDEKVIQPNTRRESQHGTLLGVLCLDFKSDELLPALERQLFFETAEVTIPETYDLNMAKVEVLNTDQDPHTNRSSIVRALQALSPLADSTSAARQEQQPGSGTKTKNNDSGVNIAFSLQRTTLTQSAVQE